MFEFLKPKRKIPPAKTITAEPRLFSVEGDTMGTRYEVKFVTKKVIDETQIASAIHSAVSQVDNQMSTWKCESDLSRFNRSKPGDWFEVPPDLALVVAEALDISALSGGAFDVTVGSAVNLWGFGPDEATGEIPAAGKIAKAKSGIGYKRLTARLNRPALKKSADCYVDLSGIAKGFGVDKIASVLEGNFISDYFISIDGEVRVKGKNKVEGRPWNVAIEAPIVERREVWDILQPRNCALATSGDYRKFFTAGDKNYAHTIDAKTGAPLNNEIGSITVSASTCMQADALATALLVLGTDKGVELANKYKIAALFICRRNGRIDDIMTGNFDDLIG